MDTIHGTLSVFILVSFNPIEGNQKTSDKRVTLETFRGYTQSQAKGLWRDWKGQNQGNFNGQTIGAVWRPDDVYMWE